MVKSFSALIVLSAFFVSTTGFTFYNHMCSHHGREITFIPDSCCQPEAKVPAKEKHSCCETSKESTTCRIDENETTCCEFDLRYFRLSEQFIDPQPLAKLIVSQEMELDCFGFHPEESPDILDQRPETDILNIKSKQPRYRLFQQEKTDPPLV